MADVKNAFLVKDIVKLSKLPSVLINNLLDKHNIYLSRRILCYVLAQQISIQISNDVELVSLRGYVGELEDYTMLQLVNFTDIHNISIDTRDLKFRLWTVIFSNLNTLSISREEIDALLGSSAYRFEYAKDMFRILDRFVDEPNDIDGQPFIIARESLLRFSTKDEIIKFGETLGIDVPNKVSKDLFMEHIIQKLEDNSDELRNELESLNLQELEDYAEENFLGLDATLNIKDIINYISNEYNAPNVSIFKIEYINYLQIPALSVSFVEEDNRNIDELRPKNVLDESLRDMISEIIDGEDHKHKESISEEKSREELDQIINKLVSGYNVTARNKPRDEISSNRERELLERMEKLERQARYYEPRPYDNTQNVMFQSELLARFSQLERRLLSEKDSLQKEEKPNNDNKELLKKIEELESKLSKLSEESKKEETSLEDTDFVRQLDDLEHRIGEVSSREIDDEYIQSDTYYDDNQDDYIYEIEETVNNDLELKYELKPEDEKDDLGSEYLTFDPVLDPVLEPELEPEEKLEPEEIAEKVPIVDEEKLRADVEKYIDEIHSARGQSNLKVRRRKTILPVVVFWKALVIWALIHAISASIFIINDLI